MQALGRFIVRLLLLALVLVAIDQVMVRVPMRQPLLVRAQTFYCDFRQRLLALNVKQTALSVEKLIERDRAPAAPVHAPAGYVYADDSGALQFVDSLDKVPERYRPRVQALVQ